MIEWHNFSRTITVQWRHMNGKASHNKTTHVFIPQLVWINKMKVSKYKISTSLALSQYPMDSHQREWCAKGNAECHHVIASSWVTSYTSTNRTTGTGGGGGGGGWSIDQSTSKYVKYFVHVDTHVLQFVWTFILLIVLQKMLLVIKTWFVIS